ncbi:MAG TPA: hypothetical protein VKX17_24200 [Planctomycetota bacterium]|nr:hypothetical protein [Planctomycetota bacterium]
MKGVHLSKDEVKVDVVPRLSTGHAEFVWRFDYQEIEFRVSGDSNGPNIARFDLARRVTAQIDEFRREAIDYLAHFVVPAHFGATASWYLVGVDFGLNKNDADVLDAFEIHFVLDEDGYGLWGVRFADSGKGREHYYPFEFNRQQV